MNLTRARRPKLALTLLALAAVIFLTVLTVQRVWAVTS